jgi:hypothetical protein
MENNHHYISSSDASGDAATEPARASSVAAEATQHPHEPTTYCPQLQEAHAEGAN